MIQTNPTHVVTADGESTANWYCQRNKYFGTPMQFTNCARCGECRPKRKDQPAHNRDIFKPTFHQLCDTCYEELPE